MSKRLFVGNLSYDTTEDSLREGFEAKGCQVVKVQVVLDRETGRSRGFAFVEFESEDLAASAREAMDGQEVDGRRLRIDLAQERAPRRDGPGGGAGGGDAGGGARGRPSGGGGFRGPREGGGGFRDDGPREGGFRDAGSRDDGGRRGGKGHRRSRGSGREDFRDGGFRDAGRGGRDYDDFGGGGGGGDHDEW